MTVRLHVGNLPNECRKEEVEAFFEEFKGDIVDLWIARNPPGFGFVTVNEKVESDFISKFEGKDFGGRPLKIERAKNQSRGGPPARRDDRRDDRRDSRRDDRRDRSRDRKRSRSDSRDKKRRDSRDRRRRRSPSSSSSR